MNILFHENHTINATGLVVAVPRSAVTLPDCVLDPLLRVLVETIGNVLTRYPRLDVLTLHLLDDLDAVLADTEQRASHRTILDGPMLRLVESQQKLLMLTM